MRAIKFAADSDPGTGNEESWKKVQPPLEVPSREEADEYTSINDDPKEIESPKSRQE